MNVKKALESLQNLSVFVGYNTDVDIIKHIDNDFERLFSQEKIERAKGFYPKTLDDEEDLLAAIINCMSEGKGDEIDIHTQKLRQWMDEKIEPDKKRMGGQAGIMSNLLSRLGCRTIVFTSALSPEQASMFRKNDNLFFPCIENNEMILKHPKECPKNIPTKKNYIFEFYKNQSLFDVKANSNRRFIASSAYQLENLELGKVENYLEELVTDLDCMILSGYHNLMEEYEDGSTWKEHFESAKGFIKKSKEINPDLKIQIEFASSFEKEIREAFLKELVPLVDVLSFDSDEINQIRETLEIGKTSSEKDDPVNLYKTIKSILGKLNLGGMNIHTLHYFLSISKDFIDPVPIKKGFEFARNLSWTRASGQRITPSNIADAQKKSPSSRGIELREKMGEHLDDKKFKRTGIHRGNVDVVFVPNKVFENPEITVGLGDVISASSFALENALR